MPWLGKEQLQIQSLINLILIEINDSIIRYYKTYLIQLKIFNNKSNKNEGILLIQNTIFDTNYFQCTGSIIVEIALA